MINLKRYFIAFLGVFFFVGLAQARVCFLPGGSDDDEFCLGSLPVYHSLQCPGFSQVCEHPKSGAQSCTDFGVNLYASPSDCCENGSFYEVCDEGTVCESGHECASSDGFTSCDTGYCSCPDYYRLCDGNGQIGIGQSCTDAEGTKYMECECDRNKYYNCKSPATGAGQSCQDDGGIWYTECRCPSSSDWVSDRNDCLCGTKETCINRPSGTEVYTCLPQPVLDCKCGYVYNSGCPTGCTDSSFDYAGSIPANVTCTSTENGLNGHVCGKGCNAWPDCSGYTLSYCPSNATCDTCRDGSGTHYRKTGCESGYHNEGGQCVEDETWPDCSSYTLSYCPSNATCDTCRDGSGTHYKKTGCESGYVEQSGSCVETCTDTCASEGLKSSKPSCGTGETSTSSKVCDYTCWSDCECTSPCSDVSIPNNAHGTTTTTACGKSCYTAWACDSGYVEKSGACVEACTDTCASKGLNSSKPSCGTGETSTSSTVCGSTCWSSCTCTSPCTDVSIPNNAHGSSTTKACGVICFTDWECDSGYVEKSGSCDKDCSGYTLTQKPDHAKCDSCTNSSGTKYSCNGCEDGYVENFRTGECQKSLVLDKCADYLLLMCPSHAVCDVCKDNGKMRYKETGCEDGYHKENGACVLSCEPGFVEVNGVCVKSASCPCPYDCLQVGGLECDTRKKIGNAWCQARCYF